MTETSANYRGLVIRARKVENALRWRRDLVARTAAEILNLEADLAAVNGHIAELVAAAPRSGK